jgi:hypothetical protein
MESIQDFVIAVYCFVDDTLKKILQGRCLRRGGRAPKLSDAEALCIALVGEFLGYDSDANVWLQFAKSEEWKRWFPGLGSRSSFVRQCSNLWAVTQALRSELVKAMQTDFYQPHITDSMPVVVANIQRAKRAKVLAQWSSRGYCAAKKLFYYGLKAHLVTNRLGVIEAITLTAANVDDRAASWDILQHPIQGFILGDKGYLGIDYQQQLEIYNSIRLLVPVRKNMKTTKNSRLAQKLGHIRKRVETVIGQLQTRFHLNRVRNRKQMQLTSKIYRKVLAHTLAVYFCCSLGLPPLQFDRLLSS